LDLSSPFEENPDRGHAQPAFMQNRHLACGGTGPAERYGFAGQHWRSLEAMHIDHEKLEAIIHLIKEALHNSDEMQLHGMAELVHAAESSPAAPEARSVMARLMSEDSGGLPPPGMELGLMAAMLYVTDGYEWLKDRLESLKSTGPRP
jgi:hypothetical protein